MMQIIVVGAGAAGMLAAIYAKVKAKNPNNQVTILERNNDCGKKMYFQSPVKDLKNKDHYRCSSYKHDTSLCTSHYISDKILQVIVLENIQRVNS